MENYDSQYAEDNVYGHVVDLVGRFAPAAGSLFLDFGCGFGRIAEVIRDRYGLHYVGMDINEPGLNSLKQRGFDAMFLDLSDPEAALAQIDQYLPADKPVAALCIIDTLEHVSEPMKALGLLRNIAQRHTAPLLVSVPNVAHRDIGFKLAMGQWDYTLAGLLDHTHLQYFTEHRVAEMMISAGWHEVHRKDVLMTKSDQHFPQAHPALSDHAPLHRLLRRLRAQVDGNDVVNQFVGAYLPGPAVAGSSVLPFLTEREPAAPFLTVVTRTQGARIETLRETLLCLSAQSCQDFEVCVIGHDLDVERQLAVERVIADLHGSMRDRVRLVRVYGGTRATPLNSGFEHARGQYVAVLDDDDLVFGHWVETFKKLSEQRMGQLLRLTAVAQDWDKVNSGSGVAASRAVGGMRAIYPEEFDLVSHLVENRSPLHSLAFPRTVYSDLNFRFDDALTTAEDWDFIIRIAPVTGVESTAEVGCIYRQWKTGETSFTVHSNLEWQANYFYTLRKIDDDVLLMPAGSVSRLREMYYELERMHAGAGAPGFPKQSSLTAVASTPDLAYLEALRHRHHELVNSKSWRITSPLRTAKRILKRQKWSPEPKDWLMNIADFEYRIRLIEHSSSWRMTSWLRKLRGS